MATKILFQLLVQLLEAWRTLCVNMKSMAASVDMRGVCNSAPYAGKWTMQRPLIRLDTGMPNDRYLNGFSYSRWVARQ